MYKCRHGTCTHVQTDRQTYIPYMYKFSRDVIFAVFVDNLCHRQKLNPHNAYGAEGMILENKTTKILDFDHTQKLHPSKICTHMVSSSHNYTVF